MHDCVDKLIAIQKEIQEKSEGINDMPNIIEVSKTFPLNKIIPLINHGHIHFGENKVQEAVEKWTDILKDFKNLKLHMVGKLQTNKVKFAVPLFDYIHSLDSVKLAEKISNEQSKINKKLNYLYKLILVMKIKKVELKLKIWKIFTKFVVKI